MSSSRRPTDRGENTAAQGHDFVWTGYENATNDPNENAPCNVCGKTRRHSIHRPTAATVERLGVIRRGIKELASGLPVSDVMMLVMSAEEKLAMAQDLIEAEHGR